MRKNLIGVLLVLVPVVLSPLCAQNPTLEKKLIGVWRGTGAKGQPIQFTFGPDNAIECKNGAFVDSGTYRYDPSKTPGHIDFIFKEAGQVQTIVAFLSDNKIRIENNDPGDARPKRFSYESVVLMRKGVPPDPERKRPDSPAAMSPQDAGEAMADLYHGAMVQSGEIVKDHPPAETAKARLLKLKDDYIQKFTAIGRRREAMSAAEKDALEKAFDQAYDLKNPAEVNIWGEVQNFYKNKDKQVYDLIHSFEFIDRYAKFEQLKKEDPAEAARLGIK